MPAARRSPGPSRRWGSLQGGLGVCIVMASAAVGAIVTVATGHDPGTPLGVFIVIGTIAAALAVRPSAGRMLLPAPVLSYLIAALIAGIIHDRSANNSGTTALAIGAAQWVANGFFAMAFATGLAIALVVARWYRQRRNPAPTDATHTTTVPPDHGSRETAPRDIPATKDATGPVRPQGTQRPAPVRTPPSGTRTSVTRPSGTQPPRSQPPGMQPPGMQPPGWGRGPSQPPPRGTAPSPLQPPPRGGWPGTADTLQLLERGVAEH